MAKSYGITASGEEADVKRGDLACFWPENLLPMSNYRFGSFDSDPEVRAARDLEIDAMVESLCSEQQKQPISIHEVPGKRFKVHSGDTRHQAFLRINERRIWPWGKPDAPEEERGRARIMCRVENFSKDAEKEVFGSSIVENLARNNLSQIDVCIAVAEAGRLGYTDAEILSKFRQTDPAFLPNMRRLARLPDTRKREIHLGYMAASVGYLLAEIPEEFHAEVLAEAAGEQPEPWNDEPQEVVADTFTENEAIREVQGYAEAEQSDGPISYPDGTVREYVPGDVQAEAEPVITERTLDTSESQAPPPRQNKAAGKTSKPKTAKAPRVTARAVAGAAKKRGLLKHKRVAHTVAGMKNFYEPLAADRKDSLLGRLAQAHLDWFSSGDDDAHYKALLSILKEVK